jgi:alcohol dehydrogenase (cytochrome c)
VAAASRGAQRDQSRTGSAAAAYGVGRDWPLWGGDATNGRHSTLAQINTDTISSLGGAWVAHLNGEQVQAAPVVADGMMFVPTLAQHLYALDATTGRVVWQHTSDIEARVAGGFPLKGVALGGGMVFLPQVDTRMVALDQKTGRVVWTRRIGSEGPGARETINAAPLYAGGLVVSGFGGGDNGVRGRVTALDARTGREVWRFDTIPGPGERGHDTWPWDNDAWRRGGAAVWSTPAADAELGLVYFNTGNAWPNFVGDDREGDNLFAASIVALDLRTGRYRWHYQIVHHDIWDMDAAMPVVLFDATVAGRRRAGIATFRPDGHLFMLDRETGKPLYEIEERPVKQEPRQKTAATQPYPVGADQLVPNCVERRHAPPGFVLGCFFDPIYDDLPNLLVPSSATRHAPMSYDPETGYFYAVANVSAYHVTRRTNPVAGAIRTPPGFKNSGVLAAIDGRTNKVMWRRILTLPSAFGSGVMTTAGGLLFHGDPDGNLEAYDSKTGRRLWRFQTGFGADAPATTFEAGGEQYVAVTAGGSLFTGGARGDAVWAFKLNGSVGPLPAPVASPAEQPFAGPVSDSVRIELGPSGRAVTQAIGGLGILSNDDFTVSPARTRVRAGSTVTWTNTGTVAHSAAARDGSWSTGPIEPGASASIRFDRPGTFTYVCAEHQWTIAQLIVE